MELKYRSFFFASKLIKFLDTIPQKISIRIIVDQLIRCATSIGANVTEATGSGSRREFTNYFQIALKSANETKYWLALLKEIVPQRAKDIEVFIKETQEISNVIGSSILTLRGRRASKL